MDLEKLLRSILERKASDLHLDVACSPVMRINGELIKQLDACKSEACRRILLGVSK